MKIGFDAKRAFHNFRGLGNYSRDLIASLSRYHTEHSYYLFTPDFNDDRAIHWLDQYNNLNVVRPKDFVSRKFPASWRSFKVAQEAKDLELDIFHGLSHELPQGIEKTGIKTVVTIHDLLFLRFPQNFKWLDRQVYFKKIKYATEVADVVIAICEQTKTDLINYLGCPAEKIRVVYQTCNPRFYSPIPVEKQVATVERYGIHDKFILYVGAIEPNKNTMTLVKAYADLKKSINHKLVIVGNGGKYKKQVESYIHSKGLEDRVIILSNVTNDDLPAFYQRSDLFCFPSFFEGFGIPIIEALFSKTPVITSKGSVFPEAGGPNTIYVDPNNKQELSEQISNVLTNHDLAFEMVEMGRNFVEKFHRRQTAQNLVDLYNSL
ncbi:glycosyltransferase, group 1 family protein [Halobacteriovorax sp. BALOs_7]|uniref:glycosyltransferase family 4 protein n=1 Tax=unclassified Halobacteriovorax TaxID=2639665 RepID=UPI000EA3581A|nr:glycosyltransferase family 1 protein [Halobacteriovorax sp. BALOs_7]AYF44187.1 glycosyltransferase, group 1 family protein [Halobacteriovorax sp. BALOs_7]